MMRRPLESPAVRFAIGAVLGLLLALWMVSLKLYWFSRTPEGWMFHGWLQGDQKTYAILIRAAVGSPFGLAYAYPWDYSDNAPRIFFQLPVTLMAWLWYAFPSVPLHDLFDLFRAVFAAAMFGALALFLHRFFRPVGWFAAALLLSAFGGGWAWLGPMLSSRQEGYLAGYFLAEQNNYWWFLHLFRNIYYPFEVLYHFLFFAMAFMLLRGRQTAASAVWLLGLLANPFLGIQMGALLLPSLALESTLRRRVRLRSLPAFALALVAGAAFIGYYAILLPANDVAASISWQHRGAYPDSLSLRDLLVGHSPWVQICCLSLFFPRFRRRWTATRAGRLLMIWAVSALLLANNGRFLPSAIQPMHFTRGYLHVAIIPWSLAFLRHFARHVRLPRRVALPAAGLACVILSLDSAVFVACAYQPFMRPEMLDPGTSGVVRHFTPPRPGVAIVEDPMTTMWLYSIAGQPTRWGDPYITPHYRERIGELESFYNSGNFAAFRDLAGVAAFIVDRARYDRVVAQLPQFYRRALEPLGFGQVLANERHVVFERSAAGEDQTSTQTSSPRSSTR